MTSRISGFYKLSPEERLDKIADKIDLNEEEKSILKGDSKFSIKQADRMIENVIGYLPIPLGIAANFKVNGRDVFVPMVTEEPSVIAAASNAAKLAYDSGGFMTSYSGSIMIGQIQVTDVQDPYGAMARVYENKQELINLCNQQDPKLVSLGDRKSVV